MLFNSIPFLFFFTTVVVLFFILPQKLKNPFLLAASYYFYFCGKAEYVVVLAALTLLTYFSALLLARPISRTARKTLFVSAIIFNLCPLAFLKYFNFISSSLQVLLDNFKIFYSLPILNFALPVGISFYTFISIGYLIDVYWKKRDPERNIVIFGLYVSFFPHILSGPIARSNQLMPQFRLQHFFTDKNASDGLKLMLWGFFMKLVVADNLSPYVDSVYSRVGAYSGSTLLFASYLYSFQIYCDFAGYSNIAIGAARIMGFDLINNFNRPYFSESIRDFWSRWHISLSTWLRDYIYIPLGGNRVSRHRLFYNVFIVFLLCGIWHGADWTFVIWGLLHAFFIIISIASSKLRDGVSKALFITRFPVIRKYLAIFITFNLANLAWIFFRARSVGDAILVVRNIFHLSLEPVTFGDDPGLFYGIAGIFVLLVFEIFQKDMPVVDYINARKTTWRWMFYIFCLFSIILLGALDGGSFIYFQF